MAVLPFTSTSPIPTPDSRATIKQVLALTMPESVAELAFYLRTHLGYALPSRPACPDHDAPLTFLAEAFFHDRPDILEREGLRSVSKAIVMGSRKSGKTLVLALLHLLNSLFKPGCYTTHVGATHTQGNRCYQYFTRFLTLPQFAHVFRSSLISLTRLKNGSTVEILSGSVKSVSGPTPQKLSIDEFDQWDYDIFQTALQMTVPTPDITAQSFLVSTRYSAHGLLSRVLPEAQDQGYTVYRWCEWDTMQSCKSCDPACPLHTWTNPLTGELEPLCRQRLLHSTGFRPLSDLLDKFTSSDPMVWAVQRNLANPSAAGLIFDTFDDHVHIRPSPAEASSWPTTAGVDWGYADPAVILVGAWSPSGDLFIIDELYATRLTPDLLRQKAQDFLAVYGLLAFYADPSEPGSIEHWRASGLPCEPASRHQILDGISAIRLRLRDANGLATLFIDPRCTHLLSALRSYKYSAEGEQPAKRQDDHPIDALRYLLQAGPPPTFTGYTIPIDYATYRHDRLSTPDAYPYLTKEHST